MNEEQYNADSGMEPEENEGLSFTDKMTGVLTEPSATFEQLAGKKPKTLDWLLPFLILATVISVSMVLRMSDPAIGASMKEKQMEQIRENFQQMIDDGTLTAEQADEQMAQVEEGMAQMEGTPTKIITVASIFIIGTIFFFIISAVYFFVAKIALKGTGEYSHALLVNGLTSWIILIQIILATIFSYIFGRMMEDLSVASFMAMDKTNIAGFLLSKVEPFSIWAYTVVGIGLAKLFHSKDTKKYVFTIIGVWLGFSLLWFLLQQAFPFLGRFGG